MLYILIYFNRSGQNHTLNLHGYDIIEIYLLTCVNQLTLYLIALYNEQSFPLRISQVNVTKFAAFCHIYCRNL